ncbi:MAG: alanine racemase [Sedimenticolaceae bacterium]
MSRPTSAFIDTQAFVANYRYAKSLAPGARALAVVKANAYGHGAVVLARALADEADAFGVACSEEAMELRESGVRNPIVLLEGAFDPAEIDQAAAQGFTLVIHTPTQLVWLLAARPVRPLGVWLKIDTGMHRLGFPPDQLAAAQARLAASPNVRGIVVMTHFARADEPHDAATDRQLTRFAAATDGIGGPFSLANSAAILNWPATRADWVRPGIMLYGSSPFGEPHSAAAALAPVMRLESRLIAIHDLAAGESVGYGGRFTCERPTRVGVVAIGYADGYPRHAPDGTPVAVNGRIVPLIGRVSMDMLTVDLNTQPEAKIGDPVQLWGDIVSANEVARRSGTIAYALFTGVTRRVHLVYR